MAIGRNSRAKQQIQTAAAILHWAPALFPCQLSRIFSRLDAILGLELCLDPCNEEEKLVFTTKGGTGPH